MDLSRARLILNTAKSLKNDSLLALNEVMYNHQRLGDLLQAYILRATFLDAAIQRNKPLNPEDKAVQILLTAMRKEHHANFETTILDGNIAAQQVQLAKECIRIIETRIQPLMIIAEGARLLRALNE